MTRYVVVVNIVVIVAVTNTECVFCPIGPSFSSAPHSATLTDPISNYLFLGGADGGPQQRLAS
jgi:hypothetical protein